LRTLFLVGEMELLGRDKHEKVPWDGGREHLELLVGANATSWRAAPDEAR